MTDAKQAKTALLTGGTGAIGGAIAKGLAAKGYNLILAARNEAKARRKVEEIRRETGSKLVRYELADLSRHEDILALAARVEPPLDVLVNNAAVTPPTRKETPEGIELQFATNVLGYFWMTQSFRPHLAAAQQGRIVDVASYWAGGLDLTDLEFKRRRYTNGAAYRQSKQANRMLVAAWSQRLSKDGISINACHPGDVSSTLSNNLGFGGSQSPAMGAETPIWLAASSAGVQFSGEYFEHKRQSACHFSQDLEVVNELYKICQEYS
jgi:NAD(P)-dependent dehydrogenase (short-subunit alcohol dehydrogenase family)